MRRALLLATALAVPFAWPASASSTLLPVSNCYSVADAAGDVADHDLDLLGLSLRTTGSSLQAYLRVSSLQTAPRFAEGHRFAVAFGYRGHRFTAAASSSAHGLSGVRDVPGVSTISGGSVQLTDNGTARRSTVTAQFDTTHSFVVLDIPLADLTKTAGAPATGFLTAVEATSAAEAAVATYGGGDSTIPAGQRTSTSAYLLGDNSCFGPAPAVLSVQSPLQAQYADQVAVAARLLDGSGRPLAGRQVSVSLAGVRAVATTSSDGSFSAVLDPRVVAGSYPLTLAFAGDSTAGASTLTSTVTVVAESTVLTLRTSKRSVLATLKDDDGQPVVGANVTFSVNGSRSTVVTSSKGVAELRDVARSTTVTASFGAVDGQYTASSASLTTRNNNGQGDSQD